MRRTSTVLGSSVVLVLAMGAFADSFTDTGNAQWSAFTNTNINTGNNLDLQIADVIDSTDTWYRFPFDGVTWSLELDKDDDVDYSDRDRCLVAQSISSTDIATINGTDYRAGTTRFNGGGTDYESTVATGSLLAMPAGLATVNEVQFVTAGAKNAGSSYTVRFHYADNSTADVVVPIVVDTDTTITRESTGANYDVFRYTGLTHTSDVAFDVDGDTFSDCGGDGADEVWVTNPNLAKDVDDIEFIYTDFTTATADWLGGPLAVNVLTDPADLSASILFEGDIDSGEDTTIDAATGALWYQLSWNATIPSDGSVLEAYVSCSATGGAGTFSPEVVVDLASGSSHVLASPCEGQYLRYRLEFTAGWDISPTLDDITFDWDPDTDTDGYGSLGLAGTVDCDDTDGAIKPGAVEIVGDEVDQNCDNIEECWLDSDNDVDRSNSATKLSTTDLDCTDFEEALDSDPIDCNDSDNSINSGATELAGDEIDQNCDNLELCYADADADTYRHISNTVGPTANLGCEASGEALFSAGIDCNDNNSGIKPGATEVVADGIDQDCDTVDDCYRDTDDDNEGSNIIFTSDNLSCLAATLASANSDDCNDGNGAINTSASELTGDGVDQNCDNLEICFADADQDGYRHDTNTVGPTANLACNGVGQALASVTVDCDDTDNAVNGGGAEIVADGLDQNCDGVDDCYRDNDDDEYGSTSVFTSDNISCVVATLASDNSNDCDDNQGTIYPGATEIVADGLDQDCDNVDHCYDDGDFDGVGAASATAGNDLDCADLGESALNNDCDDSDVNSFPGASISSTWVADGADRDCDGFEECFQNLDLDNFGSATIIDDNGDDLCQAASGEASVSGDCDDNVATVYPGALEVVADNTDQDCDNFDDCYHDSDFDGYGSGVIISGTTINCTAADESRVQNDCDDNDNERYPGNLELIGNEKDNDCNGIEICWADSDDDGGRSEVNIVFSSLNQNCTETGEALDTQNVDCDDSDSTQYVGNAEVTGNGVDNDCDGFETCWADADNDNYRSASNVVFSTVPDEDCNDTFEANATAIVDCDDNIFTTNPGAIDVCGDGIDNDCDTFGDHADTSLGGFLDDDADGLDHATEVDLGTSDCDDDDDDDGLTDDVEVDIGTDPTSNDSDNDGVLDGDEVPNPGAPLDTDRDGTIDALDTDDDNDGVLTQDEDVNNSNGPIDDDTDSDGIPDFRDADDDNDGLDTVLEDVDGDGNYFDDDTDTNGLPNFRDNDDDGDGILTSLEDLNGNGDPRDDASDADGVADFLDNDDDDDGVNTASEDVNGNSIWTDDNTDGDALPNYRDADDDGDGIATIIENNESAGSNVDGDAFPNYLDTDSDQDGYSDTLEGTAQSDDDGIPDYLDSDSDNDGVVDDNELSIDSNGDGQTNRIDDDDDGDGVLTLLEDVNGNGNPTDDDSDNNSVADFLDIDDDDDGILTALEDLDADGDWFDHDTDGDGLVDFRDDDDDDDGQPTRDEDVNGNGTWFDDDSDTDGTPDYRDEDDDNDGVLTINEDINGDGDTRNDDTDNDFFPNYRDNDDDGDGIPTLTENTQSAGPNVDSDALVNYLDTDSDNDGYLDSLEGIVDTDGDGDGDWLDFDSDDDTVADVTELNLDTDGDGDNNRVDDDDDGDGVLTILEDVNGDNNPNNDHTDTDGVVDFLDDDDDDDTVPTFLEDVDGDGDWFDEDTDTDGTPNFRDGDDDGDGVRTADEDLNGNGAPLDDDTDNDGLPNFLDDDDDNDGVLSIDEDIDGNGSPSNDQSDGDGTADYLDDDDDDDGIPTLAEISEATGRDRDGDGTENYLDTDSDDDSFLDSEEGVTDFDGDGISDYVDFDSDDDSVLDADELHLDSDSDSAQDRNDTDDDGDTIPTFDEEADPVGDADGTPNYLDTDSDNDGRSDDWEWNSAASVTKDQDGDGNPDYVDTDSDDDTVLDVNELGADNASVDTDGNGLMDRLDFDDDGDNIPTELEDVNGNGNPMDDDTDVDGIDNYLDNDDDNDNVPTIDEDPNNDLSPLNDDTDGDGTPNYRDIDDDNDGELTITEDPDGDGQPINDDTDGDGTPNYLDVDDDNDGITTIEETAESSYDFDGDGTPNHLDTDSDNDGWEDAHEFTVGPSRPDFDGDGAPDYVDFDSDNDSVLDIDEEGGTNRPLGDQDTDGDGDENRVDTDDDGDNILTIEEENENVDGNPQNDDWDNDSLFDYLDDDDDGDNVLTLDEDLDGDGDPRNDNTDGLDELDYLDTDDDNDGELTITEDPDGDGQPINDDTDGDFVPNYRDIDDDGDGIATFIETVQASRDHDGDGTENHLDTDSDDDGWDDSHEWTVGPSRPDFDGDGFNDFVDTDSDGDGIFDFEEGSSLFPIDTDGDGDENRVDIDDDGDGIPTDEEETNAVNGDPRDDDYDSDGIPDYIDTDDDNDGVPTVLEDILNTGDPRDTDSDGDGILNYLDTDDDNDTVLTIDEDSDSPGFPNDTDTDGNGFPNYIDVDDDGDSIDTIDEIDPFTFVGPELYDHDSDGLDNYIDADDDNDAVDTFCERLFGVDHLRTDTDGDTITDGVEWYNFLYDIEPILPPLSDLQDVGGGNTGFACIDPWNRDGDMLINALDSDDDGDGIFTFDEFTGDIDCLAGTGLLAPDGIPNYLDYDSDGDGLEDSSTGDGTDTVDVNGDGYTGGDGFLDFDGDFLPDYLDCDNTGCAGDSDQDGVNNCDEASLCELIDPLFVEDLSPEDCSADSDFDGDGVLDGDEVGNPAAPNDTDGDGIPDFADADDDGDGVDTRVELGLECPGGEDWEFVFDPDPLLFDWFYRCDDGSYLLDDFQNTDEDTGSAWPLEPDGIPDYLDTDDDGDGRLTLDEGDADDDGDGIVNYLDFNDFDGPLADADLDGLSNELEDELDLDPYSADSDGDGVPDAQEVGDPNAPTDTDGDGIIDALDADDDGDGIDTKDEGSSDSDSDGTPNYLDTDSDNDGIPDAQESATEDADCDGLPDYLDADHTDGYCDGTGAQDTNTIKNEGCDGCSSTRGTGGVGWLGLVALIALRRRRA